MRHLLRSLDVDMEDVFDPDDPNVIRHLTDVINEERDEYVEDLDRIKRYNHFKKLTEDTGVPVMHLDPYALIEFSDEMGNLVKPTTKYGHRPCIHVFMDDCQSSAVFRDKKFLNLAIRHRHVGGIKMEKGHKEKKGALGVSLYVAIQNLKAQGGGCPRAIRNNATQLVIVGKSKDEQELKDIYSSVGGEI